MKHLKELHEHLLKEGAFKDKQSEIANAVKGLDSLVDELKDGTLEMLLKDATDKTANAELKNAIQAFKKNNPAAFEIIKKAMM